MYNLIIIAFLQEGDSDEGYDDDDSLSDWNLRMNYPLYFYNEIQTLICFYDFVN